MLQRCSFSAMPVIQAEEKEKHDGSKYVCCVVFSFFVLEETTKKNEILMLFVIKKTPNHFVLISDLKIVFVFENSEAATRECHSKMGHQTNIIQMAWIVLCIIIPSLSLCLVRSLFWILDSTVYSHLNMYSYSFFHFMIRMTF